MDTNHNRIKVADLETNQPNKTLTTNSEGKLEFSEITDLKTDNYNGLDYTEEGKALDARQGGVLKNLTNDKLNKGGFEGTAKDLENSIPNLNNPNLKFGGFPSTRNDGQLPSNKILSTDENGNLKMYTLASYPAPYITDTSLSFMPSTSGNITIKGAFFTPTMTIIITGQTVNYFTFISDNEVIVNITTSANEGNFDITLNNGVSSTFPGCLLVVLGTIRKPELSDWTILSGMPNLNTPGDIKLDLYDVACSATCFTIPNNQDFRVYFTLTRSPLGATTGSASEPAISLISATDNSVKFAAKVYLNGADINSNLRAYQASSGLDFFFEAPILESFIMKTNPPTFFFERIGTQYRLRDYNTNIAFTDLFSGDLKIMADIRKFDITNIRYVELAS